MKMLFDLIILDSEDNFRSAVKHFHSRVVLIGEKFEFVEDIRVDVDFADFFLVEDGNFTESGGESNSNRLRLLYQFGRKHRFSFQSWGGHFSYQELGW